MQDVSGMLDGPIPPPALIAKQEEPKIDHGYEAFLIIVFIASLVLFIFVFDLVTMTPKQLLAGIMMLLYLCVCLGVGFWMVWALVDFWQFHRSNKIFDLSLLSVGLYGTTVVCLTVLWVICAKGGYHYLFSE
jgi:hypothetical protein